MGKCLPCLLREIRGPMVAWELQALEDPVDVDSKWQNPENENP